MNTLRCPNCNLADWETAVVCKRCKTELHGVGTEPAANETLESPDQEPGSEVQYQQTFAEAEGNFEQSEFESSAPPLPEERFTDENEHDPAGFHTEQDFAGENFQPNYAYSSVESKPKIKTAVISMILGIVGMPFVSFFWGMLLVIVLAIFLGTTGAIIGGAIVLLMIPSGLITGIISLVKSKRRPAEFGGKGFAIAGIVCSSIGILTLPLVAAIAIPNVLAARKSANEGSAIASIRKIADKQSIYRQARGGHCGELSELKDGESIDDQLAIGQKDGYEFLVLKLPIEGAGCEITATPISNYEGVRSFYFSTNDSILRSANKNGEMANANDPPLDSDLKDFEPPKIAVADDSRQ